MSAKLLIPAVKALIYRGEEILFIKNNIKGVVRWDIPGGRVDHGEHPYNTLEREVKEETGLNILRGNPVGMYYFFRDRDDAQIVLTVFKCRLADDDMQVDLENNADENENIIDFAWMSLGDFLKEERKVSDNSLIELLKKMHS
jgi:8-oxo-dGTP pyrophosphatase MutT (NUDIX family)